MNRKVIYVVITYIAIAIGSWFLCSGCEYAYHLHQLRTKYSSGNSREARLDDRADAASISLLESIIWPLGIPEVYFHTDMFEYGWKPVWKRDEIDKSE